MTAATPEAVSALRHAAADFAASQGAGTRLQEDIALVVSEAATNAVRHTNAPEGDGVIEMTATVADSWLEIRIRDRGSGFGTKRSDGLGLGLPIIASLAAYLTICQEGHGTEVRVRFPLGA
jgi:anti-sigma regulatory factor (Ser/Thr protein kinase)